MIRKGSRKMAVLLGLSLIGGAFCLIYYCLILSYSGIGTSFAWVWLLGGLGGLAVGIVIRVMMKNNMQITGIWRVLIILAIIIGIGVFTLLEGTLIYHSTKEADKNADYMIVLGAQVRGTRISKALKKRLDTATQYLLENPNTNVIVSGGQGPGEDISEAEAMMNYLEEKGITKDRIIQEAKSTSTNENIKFSKELLANKNSSVVIVTNGFHIFRSISIAKKQGLTQVQGLAAPTDRILLLHYYVREAAGVFKDFIFGNI